MTPLTRRQAIGLGALALAAAACGGEEPAKKAPLASNRDGAMGNYGVGTQFKAAKPLTFTMLHNIHPAYPMKKDWLFWSELTKRTGVTLSLTLIPFADYDQKKAVIITAGDAPMIVPKMYPGQETPFVASGAILPVSDYVDLMPNFKDKVAKWNLQADVDTLRQEDGRYYLLPGVHEDVWLDYSLAIRTDVLQEIGMPAPTSWDELYTVLKAMKAKHPDSIPFSDRFSIPTPGGNLLNILAQSYGTQGGWTFVNDHGAYWDLTQNKFVYAGAMPQYRDMLMYLNKLVKEGLLDPESFTQKDDAATAKFTSGKSFVISTNAQTLVNEYRPGMAKTLPKATVVKIPVPLGPAGSVKVGTRLENGLVISTKAKSSPTFVAMMQFIDWLWYSDAGEEFAKWGVEGTTYTKDGAGNYKLASDVDFVGLNAGAPKHLQKDFGFSNGIFAYGGTTQLLNSTFSDEEKAFQQAMNARKTLPVRPPFPFNADEREQATLWEAPLQDAVMANSLRFILGKRPFTEWDAYVKELDGMNMSSYINMVNTAHQRFKQQHG